MGVANSHYHVQPYWSSHYKYMYIFDVIYQWGTTSPKQTLIITPLPFMKTYCWPKPLHFLLLHGSSFWTSQHLCKFYTRSHYLTGQDQVIML